MESDSIFHNPYIEKLLSAEIRLWEIPKEELRGAMAWEIYLSAFRADRALSKSYYETDLCLLKEESNGVQGVQTRLKRKDRFESK